MATFAICVSNDFHGLLLSLKFLNFKNTLNTLILWKKKKDTKYSMAQFSSE